MPRNRLNGEVPGIPRSGKSSSRTLPFSPPGGSRREIRAAGIRDFFADGRDVPDGEIGKVLEALFSDRAIPGTSPFNLFRGNF